MCMSTDGWKFLTWLRSQLHTYLCRHWAASDHSWSCSSVSTLHWARYLYTLLLLDDRFLMQLLQYICIKKQREVNFMCKIGVLVNTLKDCLSHYVSLCLSSPSILHLSFKPTPSDVNHLIMLNLGSVVFLTKCICCFFFLQYGDLNSQRRGFTLLHVWAARRVSVIQSCMSLFRSGGKV